MLKLPLDMKVIFCSIRCAKLIHLFSKEDKCCYNLAWILELTALLMGRFFCLIKCCHFLLKRQLIRWCVLPLILFAVDANSQNVEWSEKDLARSVHRAEQTFKGGEMSRAYGLFAHLVSVAGNRAFLHYRFGATCTYTSQRLSEAIEHLEIARELGILETKEAAGWHYYKARYHQTLFQFEEATMHFRSAIDMASKKENWLDDAKLRFGQCTSNATFPNYAEQLDEVEILMSHSDDYFRLYEMPVSEGRLLTVPERLRTKEDKRRHYTSQLHWLPNQRIAFYSSYGKDGDTGLDIYRVTVDKVGNYSVPTKLPFPVNGDFNDCAPVCIPGDGSQASDRLFFSSSRPEAIGGYDVFRVDGNFTGESIELIQQEDAVQLPFEINSTSDEFLYWENQATEESWLTTNRNQDFEGKEVWRFKLKREPAIPVAISIQTDFGKSQGRLSVRKRGAERLGIEHSMSGDATLDLLLAAGQSYEVSWEAKDGTKALTELLIIENSSEPSFVSEPLRFSGSPSEMSLQYQLDEKPRINRPQIQWSFSGYSNQVHASLYAETMNREAFAAMRAEGIHEVGIEKVLQAATGEGNGGKQIPSWMLAAMHEIGVATSLEELPEPVQRTREKAVEIQSQMEKIQCWDAPGTEVWKAQAMIERFGEPALAILSEEARQLRMRAKAEQDRWDTWSDAIAEYIYQTGTDSEDWNVLKAYCETQFQAFAGAYVHAEDMFRRIDSHLRFERWVAEALPMQIDAFRKDFGTILTTHPRITNDFLAAAFAAHENDGIEGKLENLQKSLWGVFADEIIGYQSLGIYTLPGMEDTQSWFLRSGGLIEELRSVNNIQDRLAKGQQAIGLAWETCREGARKKNQVIEESDMSPSAWWESFGPTDEHDTLKTSSYAGYELFNKHGDHILGQADAYQEELDILRMSAENGAAYHNSLKSAIAMRSAIHQEMIALFGGESTKSNPPPSVRIEKTLRTSDNQTANLTEKKTEIASAPLDIITAINAVEPLTESNDILLYTVQIGAFEKEPNFQGLPFAEEAFKFQSKGQLTKYGSGQFENYESAQKRLDVLHSWAEDAFIKLITVPSDSSMQRTENPIRNSPQSNEPNKIRKDNSELLLKSQRNKQFRVRIVSYSGTLEPTLVATLLRLGNEVPLQISRLTDETTYFTGTFDSLIGAKKALSLCIGRGFADAEIEVLYK